VLLLSNCPPCWAGLSPTENLVGMVQHCVYTTPSNTFPYFKAAINKVWTQHSKAELKRLV